MNGNVKLNWIPHHRNSLHFLFLYLKMYVISWLICTKISKNWYASELVQIVFLWDSILVPAYSTVQVYPFGQSDFGELFWPIGYMEILFLYMEMMVISHTTFSKSFKNYRSQELFLVHQFVKGNLYATITAVQFFFFFCWLRLQKSMKTL